MKPPAIVTTSEVLRTPGGEPIACDVRFDPSGGRVPVIVICHSFMAFKDWGFFPHVATVLAERGFTTVAFNFSRNGVRPGSDRIDDFDAFAANSFTREIADLGLVVGAVREGRLEGGHCDEGRIVLLGHSRGGGIAISCASRDPDIAALVTWSSIATFDRWTPHQKAGWREGGYLPLSGQAGVSPLRLGMEVLREIDSELPGRTGQAGEAVRGMPAGIDPVVRAPYISVPWLILHGKADVTVPEREAEFLARSSGSKDTTLLLLDSVGHLYNARTPEEDHYVTINHVISLTADWLGGVIP
jgi:pimeloyl-ACP methyl ester carboxylesterase